ncbi:MAG: GNAT family N-acetyltransferase [Treponema sp.]|nr:GNAT family N-acetyltransferase [Treponema sp.]
MHQTLKFTSSGYIFIAPGDNPSAVASVLDSVFYQKEFCLALDFSPPFVARLMAAGFIVMSVIPEDDPEGRAVLFPEMHLNRSVLFFDELHETRTAKRLLPRYELRVDGLSPAAEQGMEQYGPFLFDTVLEHCAGTHGEGWLTPELRGCFHALRKAQAPDAGTAAGSIPGIPRMVSFGLYREGRLVAGEFGVAAGRVYTSYSGYRDEDSAGTVQLVLTGRLLRDSGFAFWDLGMILPYKERLGARNLNRRQFLDLFSRAQA